MNLKLCIIIFNTLVYVWTREECYGKKVLLIIYVYDAELKCEWRHEAFGHGFLRCYTSSAADTINAETRVIWFIDVIHIPA